MAVTYGSANTTTNGSSTNGRNVFVDRIDDSSFVAVYESTSDDGYAAIGTVSGTTVSYGTAVSFTAFSIESASTAQSQPKVAVLSSSKFVVIYRKNGAGVYCICGDYSGTTINSFGSEVTLDATNGSYPTITALDSTTFVVGYAKGVNAGNAYRACTISGTTITAGSETQLGTTSVTHVWVYAKALSSTSFAAGFTHSSAGYTAVCTVSGTTITAGSQNSLTTSGSTYAIVADTATTYLLAYTATSPSNKILGRVVTYSGTTISSVGTEYSSKTFGSTLNSNNTLNFINKSSTDFGLFFIEGTNYVTLQGKISGTEILFAKTTPSFAGSTSNLIGTACQLTTTLFVLGYSTAPGSTFTGYTRAATFSNLTLVDDCIAYYKLDESSGNAADSSGSGFTLTNNGTTTYTPAKINNGADFGSANTTKSLSTTNSLGINGEPITISFWVKLNTEIASGSWSICSQVNSSTQVGYYVDYDYNLGSRKLRFYRFKWGVGTNEFSHTITLGTSNYYHVVLRYDGVTMRAEVNASNVGSVAGSGNGSGGATTGFWVGAANGGAYSSTIIDEVGVWSRPLTSTEVTELYNSGNGNQYPFSGTPAVNSGFFMFM